MMREFTMPADRKPRPAYILEGSVVLLASAVLLVVAFCGTCNMASAETAKVEKENVARPSLTKMDISDISEPASKPEKPKDDPETVPKIADKENSIIGEAPKDADQMILLPVAETVEEQVPDISDEADDEEDLGEYVQEPPEEPALEEEEETEEPDTEGPAEEDGGYSVNAHYSAEDFQYEGVVEDGDKTYTWYSQNVLEGGGLDIPGRSVDGEGYVVDGYGNVVLASSEYEEGTKLDIPFGSGSGVVYDYCETDGVIDVYTDF